MKTFLLKVTTMAALTCISGNMMVRSKEDPLYQSSEFTIPTDKCFDSFLTNLKSLDAIIYIPEKKLLEAEKLGLIPLETNKANALNLKFVKAYEFYGQIIPSTDANDDCSSSNLINFQNIEMVVFVKKEKQENIGPLKLLKLEKHTDLTKNTGINRVSLVKIDGNKINFKIDNQKEAKFLPMIKIG